MSEGTNKLNGDKRFVYIWADLNLENRYKESKSVLEDRRIHHVLNVKLHEIDSYGSHILNYKFGIEVADFMERLYQRYVEATSEEFMDFMECEYKNLISYADKFADNLNASKNSLNDLESYVKRVRCVTDINEYRKLINTRFRKFNENFQILENASNDIDIVFNIDNDLRDIRLAHRQTLRVLDNKERLILTLPPNKLKDLVNEDIGNALDKLKCQRVNIHRILKEMFCMSNPFTKNIETAVERVKIGDTSSLEVLEEICNEKLIPPKSDLEEPVTQESSGFVKPEIDKTTVYLSNPIISGLTQMVLKKPADPCFLQNYLEHYVQAEKKRRQKTMSFIALLNERERLRAKKHVT